MSTSTATWPSGVLTLVTRSLYIVTDNHRVSGVTTTAASTAGAAGGRSVTTAVSRVFTPSGEGRGARVFTTHSDRAARAR